MMYCVLSSHSFWTPIVDLPVSVDIPASGAQRRKVSATWVFSFFLLAPPSFCCACPHYWREYGIGRPPFPRWYALRSNCLHSQKNHLSNSWGILCDKMKVGVSSPRIELTTEPLTGFRDDPIDHWWYLLYLWTYLPCVIIPQYIRHVLASTWWHDMVVQDIGDDIISCSRAEFC